jgi:hypothetical protein
VGVAAGPISVDHGATVRLEDLRAAVASAVVAFGFALAMVVVSWRRFGYGWVTDLLRGVGPGHDRGGSAGLGAGPFAAHGPADHRHRSSTMQMSGCRGRR